MGRTPEIDLRKLFAPNLIINGSMAADQRNLDGTIFPRTFTGAATGYSLDRWIYEHSGAPAVNVSINRQLDAPNLSTDHALRLLVNTGLLSPPNTTAARLCHHIEGMMLRPFLYGIPFICSFWVKSNRTGTLPFSIRNSGSDRSFVSHVAIVGDSTWRRYSVYIPPPPFSAGIWDINNGSGMKLRWVFFDAIPANQTSTVDAWQTGNFESTPSSTNFFATSGADIRIAQVQFTPGITAPENFNFHGGDIISEVQKCWRYFYTHYIETTLTPMSSLLFLALDSNTLAGYLQTPVPMRANAATRTASSTSWSFRNVATGASLSQTIVDGNQSTSVNAGVGFDELAQATGMAVRIESDTGTFVAGSHYTMPMENRTLFLDAELTT